MTHRQNRPPRREHQGVRLEDIAPELCKPTTVLAEETSAFEDRWSIGRVERSHARDFTPKVDHPHLRLVNDEADFTPEDDGRALSLRSHSDKLSRKRALFDILTRFCERSDILSPILTICQPLFTPETSCHSSDKVSQHSPTERTDFTPRHNARHNTRTRRAETLSKKTCKDPERQGIIDVGGEDMLVAAGLGVLCIMAGLVIGYEVNERIKRDKDS